MLIYNAILVDGGKCRRGYVRVSGGLIAEVGCGNPPESAVSADATDARGAMLMPGMVDTHVHFREPGLTHKATIASESRAALAGGITTAFDMPNCMPPTLTAAEAIAKADIARRSSAIRMRFFVGASAANADALRALDPAAPWLAGIKLFMGSSTGNMAVGSDSAVDDVFRIAADKELVLMVHAEDDAVISRNTAALRASGGGDDIADIAVHSRIRSAEACLSASRRAVELALRHGTRLHIAHITTAAEIEMLSSLRAGGITSVTGEATPLHLTFCADDYTALGTRIKVNPSVKDSVDRLALRGAVASGVISTIGTDHAPHLPAEKAGGALRAASGAPMVQFALPLLLSLFSPETVVERFAAAPARLFGLDDRGRLCPGCLADMVLVRPCEEYQVGDSDVISPCGWTPLAGHTLRHRIERVWLGGRDQTSSSIE